MITALLIILSIISVCFIICRFSTFRRCHGYNRILKRAYKDKLNSW